MHVRFRLTIWYKICGLGLRLPLYTSIYYVPAEKLNITHEDIREYFHMDGKYCMKLKVIQHPNIYNEVNKPAYFSFMQIHSNPNPLFLPIEVTI